MVGRWPLGAESQSGLILLFSCRNGTGVHRLSLLGNVGSLWRGSCLRNDPKPKSMVTGRRPVSTAVLSICTGRLQLKVPAQHVCLSLNLSYSGV